MGIRAGSTVWSNEDDEELLVLEAFEDKDVAVVTAGEGAAWIRNMSTLTDKSK